MDFSNLQIDDISEKVMAEALQNSKDAFALFDHLAKIAEHDNCESQILRFLKRLALRSPVDQDLRSWIKGDLRFEIRALGAFLCEIKLLRRPSENEPYRPVKRVKLEASIRKFNEHVMILKRMLPFALIQQEDRNVLIFEASAEKRLNSLRPCAFAEAEQKVVANIPKPAPLPRDLAPTLLESDIISSPDVAPEQTSVRVKDSNPPDKDDVDANW